MNFSNKTIFITGACGAIGHYVSLSFSTYNPKSLILCDSNEDQLISLSNECAAKGCCNCKYIIGDITKEGDPVRIADEVEKLTNSSLDIFVQCRVEISMNKESVSELNSLNTIRIMKDNFLSIVDLTNSLSKFINSEGSIVFIGSSRSRKPLAQTTNYSCAMAALDMFTKTAAIDLGFKNKIRVNIVNPFFPDTTNKTETVLGKLPNEEGISHLVLFLSSDLACDITGTSNSIDCGAALLGY